MPAAILQLFCRTPTQKEYTLLWFHIICVQYVRKHGGQPSVRWFAGKAALPTHPHVHTIVAHSSRTTTLTHGQRPFVDCVREDIVLESAMEPHRTRKARPGIRDLDRGQWMSAQRATPLTVAPRTCAVILRLSQAVARGAAALTRSWRERRWNGLLFEHICTRGATRCIHR